MPIKPDTRLGSYEIVSLLGSGGMGEVYKTKDLKLERDVVRCFPDTFGAPFNVGADWF